MTATANRELARLAALNHAKHYIGIHEHPAGSNRGPQIDKWLKAAGVAPGNPWCLAFVHGMYLEIGVNLGGHALVGAFENWARSRGQIVQAAHIAPGDIVCYDWNGDHWPDHVGICDHRAKRDSVIEHWDGSSEKVHAGDVIAVEGNTAIGNDSDGGRVMFRSRRPSLCVGVRIPGFAKAAV